MIDTIENEFKQHSDVVGVTLDTLKNSIALAANTCVDTIRNGGKILLFGNGGSAADAQHIAAELVGWFKEERDALPAIALTTDSSILTAVGNDKGFDQVFARQVSGLANKGDVVIGISTSGNSGNVIQGLSAAKDKGCTTIGLTGKGGGEMLQLCDQSLVVPSNDTPRIQEMHILIGHTLCHLIEENLSK